MSRTAKFATMRPRDADAETRDGASGSDFEDSERSHLEKLCSVIELTAAHYWELDREHCVSQIWHGEENERRKVGALLLGKASWEAGGVPIGSTWDDHRAILEAREPFDDLVVEWTEANGARRYLKSIGRPRFDAAGEFVGYLGITQDVTIEIQRRKLHNLELALTKRLAGSSGALQMVPIMQLVCEMLGWTRGDYFELDLDDRRRAMHLSASTAEDALDDGPGRVLDTLIGDGSVGRGWEHVTSLSIDDILCANLGAVGNRSTTFVVPLVDRHEVFGVLQFHADHIDQPRDQLAVVFAHLANQIRSARERERMLEDSRESEERFASTVDLAAIGICHVALDGRIIHVNRRMMEILGYSKDELLDRTVKQISHPEDREVADPYIEQLAAGAIDSFRVEKRYMRKNGDVIWVRINTVGKWDKIGRLLHHISVVEDISERKAAEARIEHLATHDALTGLLNRSMFDQVLNKSILARRRNDRRRCALLFIDLDRFKAINDTLGHQAGDALLKAIARRIKSVVRATDWVARFGGDEFVVLLDDFESATDAEDIANKILAAVQKPIRIGKHACRVTGSIGYAVCPEDGEDAHLLMRYADLAMYAAKQAGRNAIERYTADLTTMSVRLVACGDTSSQRAP